MQRHRQLREVGGAKLKSGGQSFRRIFLAEITNFPPKAGDLKKKKKKVFAEIRRLFQAEIANFNVFSAQKPQLLPPKKYCGGARKKSGGKNENRGGIAPPAHPLATLPMSC